MSQLRPSTQDKTFKTALIRYLVVVELLFRLCVDANDELLVADLPVVKKSDASHRRFRVFVLAETESLSGCRALIVKMVYARKRENFTAEED